MRRLIVLLLCCLLFSGCAKQAVMPAHTTEPEETQQIVSEVNPEIAQLDEEYESAVSAAKSNVELGDVNTRFAELWLSKFEEYYQRLYDISPENIKILLEQDREQWLRYVQSQIELEHAYLDNIYGSGTIIPVLLSKYTNELYREKAVELMEMYEQMCSVK